MVGSPSTSGRRAGSPQATANRPPPTAPDRRRGTTGGPRWRGAPPPPAAARDGAGPLGEDPQRAPALPGWARHPIAQPLQLRCGGGHDTGHQRLRLTASDRPPSRRQISGITSSPDGHLHRPSSSHQSDLLHGAEFGSLHPFGHGTAHVRPVLPACPHLLSDLPVVFHPPGSWRRSTSRSRSGEGGQRCERARSRKFRSGTVSRPGIPLGAADHHTECSTMGKPGDGAASDRRARIRTIRSNHHPLKPSPRVKLSSIVAAQGRHEGAWARPGPAIPDRGGGQQPRQCGAQGDGSTSTSRTPVHHPSARHQFGVGSLHRADQDAWQEETFTGKKS